MKNLKRALCLVLTCAMMLGLMIMTTSAADFTDKDEIVNTDAVDTMVALNIINGKDDGSYFDPTGIVTRAEMCKMICVALNGGKDPQLGTTAYSYTDTQGNWAAGYIEYCTNLGIVAGRGDGTFDPTGTVTGTEAAKMLLVAIGYDAAAEGFTGANWAIAVNVRANQKDFYEDLEDMDPSAGLTRDNAAQMVFNAIQAVMVEYDYNLTTVDGQLSTVAKATDMSDDDTILAKKFDMDTAYGYIAGFTYDDTNSKWTYSFELSSGTCKVTWTDAAADEFGYLATSVASTGDYTDLWFRNVKILSKTTSTKTTIYGIFPDDSVVLATGTLGSITLTSGVYDSFKIGSTVYKMDSGDTRDLPIFAFNDGFLCTLADNGEDDYMTLVEKPYDMKLIDDDADGKVDYIIAVPFTVEKVTYVGSTTFTTTTGTVTKEDVNVYDGMAKNNFVKVVNGLYTADEKTTYSKIELISGTVSATKDAGLSFKIDGTYYKFADPSVDISMPAKADAGTEYEKVAVVNGYAFNMVEVSGSSVTDYAVVVADTDTVGLTGPQAKLLFTDGTKKIVDTADYYDYANLLVTYTINSDDEYELTLADADVTEDDTGFDTIVKAPAGAVNDAIGYGDALADPPVPAVDYAYAKDSESTIGGDYIAADAIVFIYGTSWKVVSGETLYKSSDAAIGVVSNAYADSDSATGLDTIKLVCVAGTTTSGSTKYGYVTATPETVENEDGALVYSVTFFDGTDSITALTTDTATALDGALATDIAKNTIITFTYDGSEIDVTDCVSLSAANVGAVTAYASDKVKFVNTDTVEDIVNDGTDEAVIGGTATALCTIDDDTVVIYIDRANAKGVDGGEIQLATDTAADNYIANCYYVLDGTDVVLLVVDVQNDILDVQ